MSGRGGVDCSRGVSGRAVSSGGGEQNWQQKCSEDGSRGEVGVRSGEKICSGTKCL